VHSLASTEPSSSPYPFQLTSDQKLFNPFIPPAGLLLSSQLFSSKDASTRIKSTLEKLSLFSESKLQCSMATYMALHHQHDKEMAAAYWMKSTGLLSNAEPPKAVDFFLQLQSVEVDCKTAAAMAASLANGGISTTSSQ